MVHDGRSSHTNLTLHSCAAALAQLHGDVAEAPAGRGASKAVGLGPTWWPLPSRADLASSAAPIDDPAAATAATAQEKSKAQVKTEAKTQSDNKAKTEAKAKTEVKAQAEVKANVKAKAKFVAKVDFPTPPFALEIAMVNFVPLIGFFSGNFPLILALIASLNSGFSFGTKTS